MKYFIDTEFIEGFHQPKFLGIPIGKKRHFIDLISIGIVCEDGQEYYAVSNEFNPKDADSWVKDNVISKLGERYKPFDTHEYDYLGGSIIANGDTWKSNKQISQEIKMFIYRDGIYSSGKVEPRQENIEFYGYYSDYDWVLFCSLFGRMIDLPKGFPMYCKDLKQELDNLSDRVYGVPACIRENRASTKSDRLEYIKGLKGYPKQTNEHNALDDAKWNLELYKFLLSL